MNVTVYSTPTCAYCNAAKEFLASIGIRFRDVNVSTGQLAAQEMINKSGQRSVPVIDINGTIIVGFNRQELLDTLKSKGYSL